MQDVYDLMGHVDSFVLFVSLIIIVSVCQNGAVRLYNSETGLNNDGVLAITGIFQVCVEGVWASFCDDGEDVDPSSLGALESACSGLGYSGKHIAVTHFALLVLLGVYDSCC